MLVNSSDKPQNVCVLLFTMGRLAGHLIVTFIRLLPALASLAISITSIVVALVNKDYYMAIPPAVGVPLSFYFMDLTMQAKDMKRFTQNNDRLEKSVTRLEATVAASGRQVTRLQDHDREQERLIGQQKASLTQFEEQVAHLRDETERRDKTISELQAVQAGFGNILAKIETFTNKNEQQATRSALSGAGLIERIEGALSKLLTDEYVRKRQTQILQQDAKLEILGEQVEKLREETKHLEEIRNGFNKEITRFLGGINDQKKQQESHQVSVYGVSGKSNSTE